MLFARRSRYLRPERQSLADLKWWEVFQDDRLQDLIRTALQQNYDLRDAVTRVEAARANLGITRSNQFPQFGVSGNLQTNRLSRNGSLPLPEAFLPNQNRSFGEASLNLLSFEVDIWGRLRRATEAARANLLGAEETRKAVVTTLVSDVATNYFRPARAGFRTGDIEEYAPHPPGLAEPYQDSPKRRGCHASRLAPG